MLMGLLVPVFMGFAALGVDFSYIQLSELQAQYAADAASHAAFVVYRSTGSFDEGRAAAEYMMTQNFVGGRPAELDHLTYGRWVDGEFMAGGTEINAVDVSVSRKDDNSLKLFFAGFLGYPYQGVVAESTTAGRNRQIMIAQDITGSFRDDIGNARIADVAFLDYMLENPYPDDMVGMSVFIGGVKDPVWSPLRYTDTDGAAIRSKFQTLDWCDCKTSALQSYYGNASRYCAGSYCPLSSWTQYCNATQGGANTRSQMPDCWTYGTNTSQGPGVDQAIDELLSYGDERSFRAIILVSDGLPCCDSQTEPRRTAATAAVDRAWDNDIHVWSVVFNEGEGDFSFMQTLTRGMGTAYETPDSTELQGIMLEIAASIPVVTVQ